MVPFIAPTETSTICYLLRYTGATGYLILKQSGWGQEGGKERGVQVWYRRRYGRAGTGECGHDGESWEQAEGNGETSYNGRVCSRVKRFNR